MKKKSTKFLLPALFCFLPIPMQADELGVGPPKDLPWLTGPLLAPYGEVFQNGNYLIDIYSSLFTRIGNYEANWKAQSTPNYYIFTTQFVGYVGLASWLDFQISPILFYNATQGKSSFEFGDLPVGIDVQLIHYDYKPWLPGIKLGFIEFFPTGKYQNLNPEKLGTDSSGRGCYSTLFEIVFYKIFHLQDVHYLTTTLAFGYTVSTSVKVKGFNTYGGSKDTNSRAFPGNASFAIFSFEYTFNKNWVYAMDTLYNHQDATHFSEDGSAAPLQANSLFSSNRSSEQLSFSPSIEYNFNHNLGLITGVWFSACGRNSQQFVAGLFELSWTF